jgi:H/ACA ribonucleoprotein complex subunit 3
MLNKKIKVIFMKKLLKKCSICKKYMFNELCDKCKNRTGSPHPPKYSPDDKYVLYRIKDRYTEST